MIHPNTIVYQSRPESLEHRYTLSVCDIPLKPRFSNTDSGIIDHIRNQPKPNEIAKHTTSAYGGDIYQMVELLGAYCGTASLETIYGVVSAIHETLNDKAAPEIKNWTRLLTGLHPEIDRRIKYLGYWKMPYSEVIGTNTIIYYAGTESVDITDWGNAPRFLDNEVVWFLTPWDTPHYIRESVRQKLDSAAVEMIQNANHVTTKYLRRNLIWEANITTKAGTGAEVWQDRPILPTVSHGASLNNDWYHQTYRVMNGEHMAKNYSQQDAVKHLSSGGYYVQNLINHLTPLINISKANNATTAFKAPLGIEETFPNRSTDITVAVDNSGQPVYVNPIAVNNDVLKPEIIQGE